MGFDTLSWAWKQKTKAKLVLIALAESANDETGECWPGLKLISIRCDMSIRAVQRGIHQLTQDRLIQVTPHYRSDGTQTSNTYQLCHGTPPEMTTYPDAGVRGRVSKTSPLEPELEPSEKTLPMPAEVFGEFGHVELTAIQHAKLKARLNGDLKSYIDRFDRWVEEQPKKTKGRQAYLSILNWFDRDVKEGKVKPKLLFDESKPAPFKCVL